LAQTFDKNIKPANSFDSAYLTAQMERRRRQGWGYRTIMASMGPDYNPGIGFTRRSDFYQFNQTIQYSWIPGETSQLVYHTLSIDGFSYFRNLDNKLETAQVDAEWKYSLKTGQYGGFQAHAYREDLVQPFSLSKSAFVPAGNYTFWQIGTNYHMTHTALKQVGGSFNLGTFYDGWKYNVNITPRWYLSKHLTFSGEYSYIYVQFLDRNQKFESHITRLRIRAALNTKLSTNAFIQYDNIHESLSANIRFRYNFREGNDLWIVFNNDMAHFGPTARFKNYYTKNRTLLVKYTYTVQH
jgi:hypothetical protein